MLRAAEPADAGMVQHWLWLIVQRQQMVRAQQCHRQTLERDMLLVGPQEPLSARRLKMGLPNTLYIKVSYP